MEVDLTAEAKAWISLIKETFPGVRLSSLAYTYRTYAHVEATVDWLQTFRVERISANFSTGGQGLELKLLVDCNRKALISRLDAVGFGRLGRLGTHCIFQDDLVDMRLAWCSSIEQYDRLTNLPLYNVFPLRLSALLKQQSDIVDCINECLGSVDRNLDLFELLVDRL